MLGCFSVLFWILVGAVGGLTYGGNFDRGNADRVYLDGLVGAVLGYIVAKVLSRLRVQVLERAIGVCATCKGKGVVRVPIGDATTARGQWPKTRTEQCPRCHGTGDA